MTRGRDDSALEGEEEERREDKGKEEEDRKEREERGDNQRKFLDKSHRGRLCHIIKSSFSVDMIQHTEHQGPRLNPLKLRPPFFHLRFIFIM